jgi:hypothetical protein
MDERPEPRPDSRQESRLADRLIPSARDTVRAIAVSARCWLVHRWSPWTLYETVRPVRAIGPSLRHVAVVTELRRRRHCVRCGKRDDRYVGQKSAPADQPQPNPPRGFVQIDRAERQVGVPPDRAD